MFARFSRGSFDAGGRLAVQRLVPMHLSSRLVVLCTFAATTLACGPKTPAASGSDETMAGESFAFKGLRWQRENTCSFAHTEGFRAAGMAEVVLASRDHHVFAKVPSEDGLKVSCPTSTGESAQLPEVQPVVLETPSWSTRIYASKDTSCVGSEPCKERFATALRKSLTDSIDGCKKATFKDSWRNTDAGDPVYIAHVRCGLEPSAKGGVLYLLFRGSAKGYAGAYALSFKVELPPRADDEILMNLSDPATFQVR